MLTSCLALSSPALAGLSLHAGRRQNLRRQTRRSFGEACSGSAGVWNEDHTLHRRPRDNGVAASPTDRRGLLTRRTVGPTT